jgi:hypothetical protein
MDIRGRFSRADTSVANIDPTITFIFPGLMNSIDFIRRYRECWQRWVVDDIGTTVDLGDGERLFRKLLRIADPCELAFLRHDQLLTGCDPDAVVYQPQQ